MKLIKFETLAHDIVYINPEKVTSVISDDALTTCTIVTTNGDEYHINENAESAIDKLVEYTPKTHY